MNISGESGSPVLRTVTQWFEQAGRADIVFPDGRYGKPFDHPYRLERVYKNEDGLIMEFDDGVVLIFCGNFMISSIKECLRIYSYSLVLYLRLDEKEHRVQYMKNYAYGDIRFDPDPFFSPNTSARNL